jgi:hypothetical protein
MPRRFGQVGYGNAAERTPMRRDPSEAMARSLAVVNEAMLFLRGGLSALQDK